MHSRMHQIAALIFFFRDSILALTFSPHRGLDIKESNSLLALGQSKLVWDLVMPINKRFEIEDNCKMGETMRNGECPEDVESRRCVLKLPVGLAYFWE